MSRALLLLLLGGCSSTQSQAPNDAPDAADAADVADAASDAAPEEVGADAEIGIPCLTATTPVVETAGELSIGRYAPVAFEVAPHGLVVLGGYDFAKGAQKTADRIDLATHAIATASVLFHGRNFATVSETSKGMFVAGGFHPSLGSLSDAELYDPATATATRVGATMSVPREAHAATVISNGAVLLTGGLRAAGFVFHDEAEIFHPQTLTFESVGPMTAKRAFHAAVPYVTHKGEDLVEYGAVLFGGDSGAGELASIERFDGTAFVASKAVLPHPSKALAAVPVGDHETLVAGGANATDKTLADAVVYDAKSDTATPTMPMATRRIAFTLTRLLDGRVLAIGGYSDSTSPSASTSVVELWDPSTGTWSTLPIRLAEARHDHVAVLLDDCRVAVVGGQTVVGSGAPTNPRKIELITVPFAK